MSEIDILKYLTNSISLFDVTLRDGLQGIDKSNLTEFNIEKKISIYNNLITKYGVKNIEIGSFVNPEILPIFNDTDKLVEYTNQKNKPNISNYVLVPNHKQLIKALASGAKNFSFIISTSNSFQLKNTNMSINSTFYEIKQMMETLRLYTNNSELFQYKTKIYISCINECPIEGKIPIENIVRDLFAINILNIDKICLSDTCGTLDNDIFLYLIKSAKNSGFDINKLSLHLHVNQNNLNEIEKIVHSALDNGITEFDVSELDTGGCSITMDKNKILPNLSYEQYYKFLTNYLMK
jgi:hydroxymethylglutaryl-CoA lyase